MKKAVFIIAVCVLSCIAWVVYSDDEHTGCYNTSQCRAIHSTLYVHDLEACYNTVLSYLTVESFADIIECSAGSIVTDYLTVNVSSSGINAYDLDNFDSAVCDALPGCSKLLNNSYVGGTAILTGEGQLEKGQCVIKLDPAFLEKAVIDVANPMRVFVTLTDIRCNGLAVVNKAADSFTVAEINSGSSSATFDWQVTAKAK